MRSAWSRRRIIAVTASVTLVLSSLVVAPAAVFAVSEFSDVPEAHPFHDQIMWLAGTGITTGFPDGTYRPEQPVTRQSMAAFLQRNYDMQNGSDVFQSIAPIDTPGSSDTEFTNVSNGLFESEPVTVTVPSGTTARLEVTVSGMIRCIDGESPFFDDSCGVRVTVDGVATWTGARAPRIPADQGIAQPYSFTFSVQDALAAGPHEVRLQHNVADVGGTTATMVFLDRSEISVTAHLL